MKKRTRIISMLICIIMLFSLITGCTKGKTQTDDKTGETTNSPQTDSLNEQSTEESRHEIYKAASTAFEPETLMLTVGGREVLWGEFYYWLLVSTEYFIENYGEIEDWNKSDGEKTVGEYILGETVDILKLYRAVENKATELGVGISEADREYLDSTKADIIEKYGGRELFEAELSESFMTEEIYDNSNEISVLYYNLFAEIFGENGETASDEETAEFAESVGYRRIKHIMLAKLDENGENLNTDTVAEKLKLAEELLERLKSADEQELEGLFDELMHEYSDDPDFEQYPNGYLYMSGSGELDEDLDIAAAELKVGELCAQVVESEKGFHILLRLAVDPDTMVDEYYTLRYYTAYKKFEDMAVSWQNETQVKYSPEFEKLNLAELFSEL